MRSLLTLAGPIGSSKKRYKNLDDDEDAQKEVAIGFSEDLFDLC